MVTVVVQQEKSFIHLDTPKIISNLFELIYLSMSFEIYLPIGVAGIDPNINNNDIDMSFGLSTWRKNF